MKYGQDKQEYVADVMQRIKTIESQFKQQKAAVNLAAQQGDDEQAEMLLRKLEKLTE